VSAGLAGVGYSAWIVVEQDRFPAASDTRASLRAVAARNRAYLADRGL
jgi:hypothetical protein